MPSLHLGSKAPDFTADTTHGRIHLHEYIGNSWTMLFSHPDDYTPVCTTEIGALSKIATEFTDRRVKLLGLSINDLASHHGWIGDINELYDTQVPFPIISDAQRNVAGLYDMLDQLDVTNVDTHGAPLTVRSVFVIDPTQTIRMMLTYPASTGRNWSEILRAIDSLQLGDNHRVTTPANWNKGDSVIVHPSLTNDDAEKSFGNLDYKKPYLRMTRDPSTTTSTCTR
ncbi:hypothetical protein E3P77_00876 [Wallemia ichthyophaga]|nr:hypothetical protein E3P91_00923 [Wallemia ichthyophaga]TIA82911.1 hypothetical protein E3P98_01118 [Wallemia ichthyophaga]TIA92800.1 hypothetical protein E3P97_01230 [Wallemia ichthyophaga]TIB34231.1 hypothetical protein E3P85_00979 [Wallemia ichthyophaga]TIB48564.1 hypothetical protein E3P82_01228 [Wallemia ichthyophaga]